MAFCPEDCVDNELVPNRGDNCELQVRKRNIDRIGFYPCSITLPAPFDCTALETLKDNNQLVFTNPLANVEIADPEYDEQLIADCMPALQIVTNRTLTFQDKIKIDIPASSSPVADAIPFYDYDFWGDKMEKRAILRYLIVYCDGTVEVPKDTNGNPMEANLNVFRSYERQGSGGNSYILEIKKGELRFKGDPLGFNKPEVDADNELFLLSGCSGLY